MITFCHSRRPDGYGTTPCEVFLVLPAGALRFLDDATKSLNYCHLIKLPVSKGRHHAYNCCRAVGVLTYLFGEA